MKLVNDGVGHILSFIGNSNCRRYDTNSVQSPKQTIFSTMITYDEGDPASSPAQPSLPSHVFSTRHKTIGLQYLWLSLVSVFVGIVLSTLLCFHASWPSLAIPFLNSFDSSPGQFAAVRLLHGSLMVFFVLIAAPQLGFGNFLLPLQIGAKEMAFPVLNCFSLWLTITSFVGMVASFFLQVDQGINIWLMSAAVFSFAALLSALNFCVTTIEFRTTGLTLTRMPVTVWAWFVNAILSLLIFSVLLAGCTAILSDRVLHSSFFPSAGSSSTMWQHLFWYFAQAGVYVAMLPCFGIITHLIATFSCKPVWRERLVVLAICSFGVCGFCVWGNHMFATGMNPYFPFAFSALAASLGIPAAFMIASWLGTLWNGRLKFTTSVLFAIGFVSLLISGGLSGIFLAHHDLSGVAGGEEFVTAHFHLIMGVAATFALLAGLFFWFPKFFGTRMNEPLGKTHFWLTFLGVYCIFMPMHWMGLLAQSGYLPEAYRTALISLATSARTVITIATIWTVAAQLLFVANFSGSLLRRKEVEAENPWRSSTLEWALPSPVPTDNFGVEAPEIYRGAYEFTEGVIVPQYLSPGLLPYEVR
jgi:cytochrome c oxidase subunit I